MTKSSRQLFARTFVGHAQLPTGQACSSVNGCQRTGQKKNSTAFFGLFPVSHQVDSKLSLALPLCTWGCSGAVAILLLNENFEHAQNCKPTSTGPTSLFGHMGAAHPYVHCCNTVCILGHKVGLMLDAAGCDSA